MTLEFTFNSEVAASNKIIARPTLNSQINFDGDGYDFLVRFSLEEYSDIISTLGFSVKVLPCKITAVNTVQ